MSKLWALTKVLLKNNFISSGSKNKKNNKYLTWFAVGLLFVFVIVSLGVPIIMALDSVLEIMPIQNIILSFILPFAGISTIIFSVFSVVNIFYLSKDSDHLLPLPIAPKDIMLSKFFVSLINDYYILFMFILPCLVGVGIGIDAGILYYVYMILIFILLPIIPSIIVTFIILLITRFTGVMKNKDVFMYVSMGLVLAFAFGYNFIIQNFISIDTNNLGTTIESLENAVLPYFRAIFPFYNSAVNSLVNYNNINGIFSLLAFMAFNIIALLFIYFLGDKLYLKTLTVTKGSNKKVHNVNEVISKENKKQRGSFYWLLKKEWLMVKRTPVYMLNLVIIVFLMPIIFIVSFAIGFINGGGSLDLPYASMILPYLSDPFIYLIVLLALVFLTCFSFTAATAISREGSNAWFMKVMPISPFKQISVKVFFACVLDLLGVVVIGIIPVILLKIPFTYVLSLLIPLVIIVVLLNYFNILIDLRSPKLKWSDENASLKQNFNAMISMLITLGLCACLGIVAYLINKFDVSMSVMVLAVIVSVVLGTILAITIRLFYKKNNELLDMVD